MIYITSYTTILQLNGHRTLVSLNCSKASHSSGLLETMIMINIRDFVDLFQREVRLSPAQHPAQLSPIPKADTLAMPQDNRSN